MNTVDSPKFRRKRTSATAPHPAADDTSPDAAEQARAEEEAQRIAKAAAQAKSEEKARRKAEFEDRAQAEALRRVKAARAQRAADALKAREDAEQAERAHREAAEAAQRAEDRRIAEERAAQARRQQAEEEAAQKAEAKRQEAEKRHAEEAARRAQAKREAEERAASALRDVEEKRRAEQERQAEQDKAEAHRVEDDTRRKAQASASVLPLTDMIPVTRAPELTPEPTPAEQPVAAADVEQAWAMLPELTVEKAHLARNRIITATREDPAHGAFDVLRTRLLQALSENGWRRVAITSPGKDCGKTFTAANLAISLSRQENCRTLLMDLDMRRPSLHRVLGIDGPGSVGDMLRGMVPPETHLHRMGRNPINAGRNIAFALNDRPEAYASELLQDPRSAESLNAIEDRFAPDVVLFDLPPALFYDDVIAARPLFDGVLLVVGGGLTTESEISEVERRLGDTTPILGMVLNKAEGTDISRYTY